MSDQVALQIAGRRIENFLSYEVEADLYQAADKFTLELAKPETRITRGDRCELYVNGVLELTGVVDVTRKGWTKDGSTLVVEGRDLMGLVVDSYAEKFITVQGKTVKQLAKMLLATVPYISRKQIVYQENVVGKLKGKKKTADNPLTAFLDTPQKLSMIEPGMTVFEVLSIYAASRGLMLFSMPDGTLVFGRPKAKGEPAFTITNRIDGQGNNVESGDEVDDISRRYSKITVVSQVQGHDDMGLDAGKVNVRSKPVVDADFPFYKPFVTKINNDSQTPNLHARLLMEKQRHEGFQLSYTASGHSQNGQNFKINELVRVKDERLDKDGIYLLFGRTFKRSKQGSTTLLKLGPPGLVAV
ncbi:hypothetical protein GMLC_14550 [Geomonas limicola]|uniref:Baseplate hub protein gp44-like N-terminal domain-containing protein n=1 Tax=Geomonas limicola TaxID=2740186 RepID=A0A6V8N5R3_9BACT|nr:hypothetical protein [Geomonas limicola]GFO67876.1 hypothetical protein GMLC_14550 [Geomonas limicola]